MSETDTTGTGEDIESYLETGKPIAEYLVTHQDLGEENAAF